MSANNLDHINYVIATAFRKRENKEALDAIAAKQRDGHMVTYTGSTEGPLGTYTTYYLSDGSSYTISPLPRIPFDFDDSKLG